MKSWLEKALKIAEHHINRQMVHPNTWKIEYTAKELEISSGYVCESLLLVKLRNTLNLDRINSRKDALRICREHKI